MSTSGEHSPEGSLTNHEVVDEHHEHVGKVTDVIFDDRDFNGYTFDYTDMASPVLTFGAGIDNPAQFQLAEFRDRRMELPGRVVATFLRGRPTVLNGTLC